MTLMSSRQPLSSLPVAADLEGNHGISYATLALQDGSAYQGISFGAEKSVAGECVFQTGEWLSVVVLSADLS